MKVIAFGLVIAVAGAAGCGGDVRDRKSGGGRQGTVRFEHQIAWEPSIEKVPEGSRIGFSFMLSNVGSASGEASCEILFDGEPLPGESTTETIEPGDQAWIRGEAFIEQDPADFGLTQLTPKCE